MFEVMERKMCRGAGDTWADYLLIDLAIFIPKYKISLPLIRNSMLKSCTSCGVS